MSKVKYPEIVVDLTGGDGNAMAIVAKVRKALRRGGVSDEEITEFSQEVLAGDYDHVIQTCMAWVEVD